MSDLISRQAAIEALRDAENHAFHSYYQGLIKAHKIIAGNRCPATCAQYRDGWNDAMNYIFRDGEGYRPFRRDKKYEG